MDYITGLLIHPAERAAVTVRFQPTLAGLHHLVRSQAPRRFTSANGRLQYLTADCPAREEDPIVYHREWPRPVPGRVLIVGAVGEGGRPTSLTPQQIAGCCRSHRIGTQYCGGMVVWEKLEKHRQVATLTQTVKLIPRFQQLCLPLQRA